MALINPPTWLQQGSYDARSDRMMVGSLFMSGGIADGSSMRVTQATTPNMTVQVSAGSAYIDREGDFNQGIYHVRNDGATTLNITPADATFARIDRIVVRVYDAQYAGALNEARFEVIAGTPASSPTVPALPATAYEIGRVTVGAGVTSIVNANINSSNRVYARLRSGINTPEPVLSSAMPANPVLGQTVFETDTGRIRMYNAAGEWWQIAGPPVNLPLTYNGSGGIIGPGTGSTVHPSPLRLFKINKTCYAVGGWRNAGGTINVGTNIQQPFADLPAAAVPVVPDPGLTGTSRRISYPALLVVGGVGFNIATFIVAPDTNQLMFQPGRDLSYAVGTVSLTIGLLQWETAVQS